MGRGAEALRAVTAALPAAERRPGQEQMADLVADAIERHRHLVVQAGTGTGKTLAYLAPAIEAWLGGCRFHELGKHTDVDEGEIIRHFRMVVQLLRQLKQAPRVSEALRHKASKAMREANRDLVDAEKQLRNMEEGEPQDDRP